MLAFYLTGIFSVCPAISSPVCDRVDLIELYHRMDDNWVNDCNFIIFWDLDPTDGCYHVVDWRKYYGQLIGYDWRDRHYVIMWHDQKTRSVLRKVTASSFRESWSQYDPEVFDRDLFPIHRRRELTKRLPSSYQFLAHSPTP